MVATASVPVKHRLKALRQAHGLAIYGLAVRARCSPTTIGAVERWGYRPSVGCASASQRRSTYQLKRFGRS